MRQSFQIAVDGPVAAGKGTVCRSVAEKLGFLYVDSGAFYRCAALLASIHHFSFDDETGLVALIQKHEIDMRPPNVQEKDGRLTTVLLDGHDVSWEIRTESIGLGASRVAVLKSLREVFVEEQRRIANSHDVVMEGRDIALRVLPHANLKIYLDAELDVRVARKMKQLKEHGQELSFEEVKHNIIDRDTREMNRATDPLHPVSGAWIFDTTTLSPQEAVEQIISRVRELRNQTGSRPA